MTFLAILVRDSASQGGRKKQTGKDLNSLEKSGPSPCYKSEGGLRKNLLNGNWCASLEREVILKKKGGGVNFSQTDPAWEPRPQLPQIPTYDSGRVLKAGKCFHVKRPPHLWDGKKGNKKMAGRVNNWSKKGKN